jgi:hypothetical protein
MSDALARYYANNPPVEPKRPTYDRDERMERLIQIRDTDPAAFERLPATMKVSLAFYENGRPAEDAG